MNEFETLKQLKIKADRLNNQTDKIFNFLSDTCSSRTFVPYGNRGEWSRCTHKEYPLSEYTEITPCNKKYCPKLK